MFKKFTNGCVRVVNRWLPDAFLFAIILTLVVFVGAMCATGMGPIEIIAKWGDQKGGFWNLLAFSMQMALVLVFGSAMASAKPCKKALRTVAGLCHNEKQAILVTTFVSTLCCWLNWGFGLVIGALLAKEVVRRVPTVDYPLLIASAYSGFVIWHAGLSGSIPLDLVAGKAFGEVTYQAPITATVFHPMNLIMCGVILVLMPFAVPVFLSQLFQQLYNTADSLIVSNFLGDNALAAVSASGPLIFLLVSFFAGAASGVGVAIARYFGAGDYDKVSRTVHTAVLLGLISSLILTVIGVLFTPTLLRWMDTDPEVLPDAIGYFRCYFAGVGAGVMYNTFTGIMNALGDSKRPLYFLIISSLTNVALDLLFVAVFRWGVWSAALATIISQALSAVLCVIHLAKKGTIYQLKLSALRMDGPLLREILRYGLPAGVQNSVIALANVVVQTNINSFGKMATAAYGAYSKIEGFAFLPVTSFTMAITTYVGQNLGAGMKPRAKKGAIFGIAAAAIIAELIGVATYLGAPWLVKLFSRTPEVIELGVLETRTICLFYCLLAFSHAIASVCRGAGKAFVPMTIMLGVWCVFRIFYITLMMQWRHEIIYVYWAYPITWAISSVIYLFYFLFSNWQNGFDPKPELPEHKHHHHFHLFHHR